MRVIEGSCRAFPGAKHPIINLVAVLHVERVLRSIESFALSTRVGHRQAVASISLMLTECLYDGFLWASMSLIDTIHILNQHVAGGNRLAHLRLLCVPAITESCRHRPRLLLYLVQVRLHLIKIIA